MPRPSERRTCFGERDQGRVVADQQRDRVRGVRMKVVSEEVILAGVRPGDLSDRARKIAGYKADGEWRTAVEAGRREHGGHGAEGGLPVLLRLEAKRSEERR